MINEMIEIEILKDLPELKTRVENLSINRKREGILFGLGELSRGDRKIFKEIMLKAGKVELLETVISRLREYITVGEVEKKTFGEVFTPFELINEMLDTLPNDVWYNPHLKWLDNSAGCGNFPVVVIQRLMKGLSEWEKDESKRFKHIIENMIYVCELQVKNAFLWMVGIDPRNEYKLNIFRGSFLSDEFDKFMQAEWGIEKFDITVANPPYNQMIDMLFLQKTYQISDKTLFVHPSTWLLDEKGKQRKFTDTKNLIKDHLESIKLFNGNKTFGVTLFVPCVFTYVNKQKNTNGIHCIDKINNIELVYDNIYQINKFSNKDIYLELKEKFNIHKNNNLLNFKNKINGQFYVNISQIRGHVNQNSSDSYMLKDDFYTLITKDENIESKKTKHVFFTFDNNNKAINFINYLKTDFVRFCLAMLKNNSQLDRGELELIPWLDFSQEWTDEKLYKYFDLTQEEIIFIEKNIPKYY